MGMRYAPCGSYWAVTIRNTDKECMGPLTKDDTSNTLFVRL